MTFPSPIIIGPASAKILAPACTTVPRPIVTSPLTVHPSCTFDPTATLGLKQNQTVSKKFR